MQTDFLKTVLIVAKYQSFSRAAEEIPCAQSSVSRQVKSVEEDLSVKLFDRNPNGYVQLTPKGQILLPLIEKLVECDENLMAASGNFQKNIFNVTLAVCSQIFSSANKSHLCSDMYLRYPEIHLNVVEYPYKNMPALLLERHIDAALFYRVFQMDDAPVTPNMGEMFRLYEISRQPLRICMSILHPLAQEKQIPFSALANENFIFHTDITRTVSTDENTQHAMFLKECLLNGFSPKLLLIDRNLADNKQAMARHRRGIYPTFVPDFLNADSDLISMPVTDAHYYARFYLFTRENTTREDAIIKLVSYLQDSFSNSN